MRVSAVYGEFEDASVEEEVVEARQHREENLTKRSHSSKKSNSLVHLSGGRFCRVLA